MPSPRYWREIPARYRLEASRCQGCGTFAYPPRLACRECRGRDQKPVKLSARGKIVTSTVIHVPPADFLMEAPYAVAVVETPEGCRLMAQVAECIPGDVQPGTDVTLEFRRIRREGKAGILCYGMKAVPVTAPASGRTDTG